MHRKTSFIRKSTQVLDKGLVRREQTTDYSKNLFSLPVPAKNITAVGAGEFSPAHIGNLINSIDFIVPEGTKIYAAADGLVIATKDSSNVGGDSVKYWDDGNNIDIKHANNEFTWYEHLRYKGIVVKSGDRVKRGQLIGYSGNTGFSDMPHLHFQVNRYFGKEDTEYVTLRARFRDYPDVYKKKK